MARGSNKCGGETSGTDMVNQFIYESNPRSAASTRLLREIQMPKVSTDVPKSGQQAASVNAVHFSSGPIGRVRLRPDGGLS